jgi:hypothetical protein
MRLEHMLSPDHEGKLPDGQPSSLIARETQAAGAWTDDSGKGSWFLSRAREVFAPLTGDGAHPNGQANANGHANPDGEHQGTNGQHAAAAHEWDDDEEQTGQIAPPPPPARWPERSRQQDTDDEGLITVAPVRDAAAPPATPSRELYSYRPARRQAPPTEDEE